MKKFLLLFFFLLGSYYVVYSTVSIIPTDTSQKDFLRGYKFALYYSYLDYRFTNSTMDSVLFPKYGEFSIYWIVEGENAGSFVYPDAIPKDYASVTREEYSNYEWRNREHFSLQFKHNSQVVCIFQSEFKQNNATVSWASFYYKNLFDMNFFDNMYYFANEKTIDSVGISSSCRLLIIPPFRKFAEDDRYYIDKIFEKYPNIKRRFDDFLARGGTIYAEGNAVYFIEKLGYLEKNSVDFENGISLTNEDNLADVNFIRNKASLIFHKDLQLETNCTVELFPKLQPM